MELGYGTLRIRYRETATNLSNVVYIEYDIIKTLLEKRYYNNINIKRAVSPPLSRLAHYHINRGIRIDYLRRIQSVYRLSLSAA